MQAVLSGFDSVSRTSFHGLYRSRGCGSASRVVTALSLEFKAEDLGSGFASQEPEPQTPSRPNSHTWLKSLLILNLLLQPGDSGYQSCAAGSWSAFARITAKRSSV